LNKPIASTQIPRSCTSYTVSKDSLDDGVYHFMTYWETREAARIFSQSTTFSMLIGAFKTLGELYENGLGELIQYQG